MGLDHMIILRERSSDAPHGELGLRLGKPATTLAPPELGELEVMAFSEL